MATATLDSPSRRARAGPPGRRRRQASRSLLDPHDRAARRSVDSVRKLDPRHDGPQPGDVRRRARQRRSPRSCSSATSATRTGDENVFAGLVAAVAVVHGAVRQLRRGHGRGPGQGPGRHPAQGPRPRPSPTAGGPTARSRTCRRPQLQRRRRRASSSAGEMIPSRRRDRRGHRQRRRVGHHRRVGAGHPRVGRRPLGGHRRHPGAVRPDRRAHHGPARARRSSTG